jgi:hypothetical protein
MYKSYLTLIRVVRYFDRWIERRIELSGKDSTLRGRIKILYRPSADHHLTLVSYTRKALPCQTHFLIKYLLGAHESDEKNETYYS